MSHYQHLILDHCQIRFQYYEYTQAKEKVLKHDGYRYFLEPYALEWKNDHYYLIGYSHRSFMTTEGPESSRGTYPELPGAKEVSSVGTAYFLNSSGTSGSYAKKDDAAPAPIVAMHSISEATASQILNISFPPSFFYFGNSHHYGDSRNGCGKARKKLQVSADYTEQYH